MHNQDKLEHLLNKAINYKVDPLLAQVANSKEMLSEIRESLRDEHHLRNFKDKLNVGLLAAKSLDYYGVDANLYDYATLLHNVWAEVIISIGLPFSTPTTSQVYQKRAYDFYVKHGYDQNRIGNHMTGIDFNCPVNIISFELGDIVGQWRALSSPQGDYYVAVDVSVQPDCIGIHHSQEYNGKILRRFEHRHKLRVEKKIEVLETIAAAVLDTWSIKGKQKKTNGGCTQYFNSKEKVCFEQFQPRS